MSQLNLSCLGAFQAILDGTQLTNFHSVKVQALLAYLAVEAARPHTRETLMALLWPDDAPQSAQQSLRQALYALRRVLGDTDNPAREPFLLVTRQTIQLNPRSQVTLDVTTFLQQVQQGNLAQAVALYQTDLLVGMTTDSAPFEEWLRATREYLHNLALNALDQLTQQRLDNGDFAGAVTYARRQLALEPWREEAHRQLMTALALNGERSTALAQYDTCRRVLSDELGVEPAIETVALYEQIRAGELAGKRAQPPVTPSSVAPTFPDPIPAHRHNLPPQPTAFIGRQTDLAQLTERLGDPTCRLLTIVGPGGMGKTRLAIQAAQMLVETSVGDGVFFVALAGVASPELLVSTIATALDFTFYGSGEPQQQLLAYLQQRSLLLLLDNCEHLLDGIDLISDLLGSASNVKVLATSREPLNLREEWLHPLSGMSFPRNEQETAALESYTAVQLFTQCARQMNPVFDLAADRANVVRICRLVEGMPLGIELATTWLKLFPCAQIAREIEQSLDFLATTLRNVPVRHRSMKAVFEHSWNLLSDQEQQVLQRLSVFRGGFDRAAAEQVAGATFPLVVALAEKSLIQVAADDRYQMHELLRQFAEEKLQAIPAAAEQTQARHCAYYTSFLQRQESRLKGAQHVTAMSEIETEIENIRRAWQWAAAQRKVEEIDHAVKSLRIFYDVKCWYQEGDTAFRQAAAALRMDEPAGKRGVVYGKVLAASGQIQSWWYKEREQRGLQAETIPLLQDSLAILRRLDAPGETGEVLWTLGGIFCHAGRSEQSLQLLQEALAVFTVQRDPWGMSRALEDLGFTSCWMGKYREAVDYYQQAIALCEEQGDLRTVGDTLNVLGAAYKGLGEYEEARNTAQAALAANTLTGDKRCIAWSLQLLGELAWRLDDYATAQQRSEESVALFGEIGLPRTQDAAWNNLGNIACCRGDYGQARYYFGIVLKSQGTVNATWILLDALTGIASMLAKEGMMEQAVELLQHVLRHPVAMQVNKDWATRLLAEFAAKAPPQVSAAAQARAASQDLSVIVTTLLEEWGESHE